MRLYVACGIFALTTVTSLAYGIGYYRGNVASEPVHAREANLDNKAPTDIIIQTREGTEVPLIAIEGEGFVSLSRLDEIRRSEIEARVQETE